MHIRSVALFSVTKNQPMNKLKLFYCALCLVIAVVACHEDKEDNAPEVSKNVNANSYTAPSQSGKAIPREVVRLEFPKIKGGTSEVIVHATPEYGMTYAIEWDHEKRAQRWTCFEIYRENRVKNWKRADWKKTKWGGDPFQADPKVPANEQPPVQNEFSKSYYPNTGSYYQRGHICASEDRVYSQNANEQTFYMTNIMPQVGNLNERIWQKLENRVRSLAVNADTLYVCKGGTIDKDEHILGYTRSRFIVPRYFFMALLAKDRKGYRAIGFWVEHLDEDHSDDALGLYAVSIKELQQRTGIDFFCNLPDDVEDKVENLSSESVKKAWGF